MTGSFWEKLLHWAKYYFVSVEGAIFNFETFYDKNWSLFSGGGKEVHGRAVKKLHVE